MCGWWTLSGTYGCIFFIFLYELMFPIINNEGYIENECRGPNVSGELRKKGMYACKWLVDLALCHFSFNCPLFCNQLYDCGDDRALQFYVELHKLEQTGMW
jgi:hypothetical protein